MNHAVGNVTKLFVVRLRVTRAFIPVLSRVVSLLVLRSSVVRPVIPVPVKEVSLPDEKVTDVSPTLLLRFRERRLGRYPLKDDKEVRTLLARLSEVRAVP